MAARRSCASSRQPDLRQHDHEWISAAISAHRDALVLAFVVDRRARSAAAAQRRRSTVAARRHSPRRPTRGCASSAGSSTPSILLIGLALALVPVHRALASCAASRCSPRARSRPRSIGFAARQTLGQLRGRRSMLAITPAARASATGSRSRTTTASVEDVAAELHRAAHRQRQRIVIPNETLASGVLRNDTLADRGGRARVAVWLPRDADARRARSRRSREDPGVAVGVAEIAVDGVRLGGERRARWPPAGARPRREADAARRAACARLRRGPAHRGPASAALHAQGSALGRPNPRLNSIGSPLTRLGGLPA